MKAKRRSCGLLILVVTLLIFGGILLFDPLRNQIYLSSELIPTAEYLFKSPSPQPKWIGIKPPPSSVLNIGEGIEIYLNTCAPRPFDPQECDGFLLVKDDSFEATGFYKQWSNFYINGQKANFPIYSIVGNGNRGTLILNISPLLLPGYHLFKIEPENSQEQQNNPDPKLSYEWAYRVE
jgi:hypothetical protein